MANAHHHHTHAAPITSINNAFLIGISINFLYVIFQIIIGLKINSLALLSDAGHNFLDVVGLALALLGFKLSKSKATKNYTYGFKKASILIALLNAVILLISIFAIGYEAIFRFGKPQPLPGITISIVAAVGILINGFSALLFFKNKENDINIKAAFLHLASDALVSIGLVIAGIIIYYTSLYWIDPLVSIIICIIIIGSTWGILKDSIRLSLDGIPENVNISELKNDIEKIEHVQSLHHIHIWANSTTENALTAHVQLPQNLEWSQLNSIKLEIKHELLHHNVHHSTLEFEFENCDAPNC